jgi:ATP-binding cassette, subfamily C (CFTR/MRP), member 1
MTTVNLLNEPLTILGSGLPLVLAAYASVQRVQTFLDMDEKELEPSFNDSGEISRETPPKREKDSDSDAEGEQIDVRNTERPPDVLIQLKSASFSWLPDSAVVLEDITLDLKKRHHYMIIGSVASVRYLSLFSRDPSGLTIELTFLCMNMWNALIRVKLRFLYRC